MAQPARLPCFVPPTPPLGRGGGRRLLTLWDKPSSHLHQAILGRFETEACVVCPVKAQEAGFTTLTTPKGHALLIQTDGLDLFALLAMFDGRSHRWFPAAFTTSEDVDADLDAHTPRLLVEAEAWARTGGWPDLGWGPKARIPVHVSTPNPWDGVATASLGGRPVLRDPDPRFAAFFGLAVAFLERHPGLVWDSLHYATGLVGVRGQWMRPPVLSLAIPKRQGTFTAQAANRLWDVWSKALVREIVDRRSLPTQDLAGWTWHAGRHGHFYRSPHDLTLAVNGATNPAALGRTYDLRPPTSSHGRMALHAAFQAAAPGTYRLWMDASTTQTIPA